MLQPLVYSKFQLVNPDDAALEAAPLEPYPFIPSSKFRIVTLMSEPAVQVVYEDVVGPDIAVVDAAYRLAGADGREYDAVSQHKLGVRPLSLANLVSV